MTATLISDCNLHGKNLPLQGSVLNLGSKTFGNNEVRTIGPIQATAQALTLRMGLADLSAGALTVKISVHSGTPNFGAPTATVVPTTTAKDYAEVNTDSTNDQISLQLTAGAAGATLTNGFAELLGLMPDGDSYHEAIAALNYFAAKDGTINTALT